MPGLPGAHVSPAFTLREAGSFPDVRRPEKRWDPRKAGEMHGLGLGWGVLKTRMDCFPTYENCPGSPSLGSVTGGG